MKISFSISDSLKTSVKTAAVTLLITTCGNKFSYCQEDKELENKRLAFGCTETKVISDENDNNTRKWVVINRCRTVGLIANLKIITKTYSSGSEDTTYTIKDTTINYIAPQEILFLKNEACESVIGNKLKCTYYKKWTSAFK